jgi:hypothetical protein
MGTIMTNRVTKISLAILAAAILSPPTVSQEMDKMWGDSVGRARIENSDRVALFRDGNFGMFIHWGLRVPSG